MPFDTKNLRVISFAVSTLVLIFVLVFFDLIDNSVKSWVAVLTIIIGAGFTGSQLMPSSTKNPWLFILLYASTMIVVAVVLVFVLAMSNYAP